jgi:hypothetical protein
VLLPTPDEVVRFGQKCGDPDANGCRRWLGAYYSVGYGRFTRSRKLGLGSARDIGAHRFGYMIKTNTLIKPGFDVCHTCDNRWCVEFDHLWEGTRQENLQDMSRKGRARDQLGDTCREGHPRKQLTTTGKWYCPTCTVNGQREKRLPRWYEEVENV